MKKSRIEIGLLKGVLVFIDALQKVVKICSFKITQDALIAPNILQNVKNKLKRSFLSGWCQSQWQENSQVLEFENLRFKAVVTWGLTEFHRINLVQEFRML